MKTVQNLRGGGGVVAPSRPVLRWHGGKFMLAPWIIGHFPAHQRYVEPFGGAASVLLQKPKVTSEVYNDLDKTVVNLFKVLREPKASRELKRRLKLTPFSRTEFEATYGAPSKSPIEAARRLVVRSFMGFGCDAATSTWRVGFRSNAQRFAKWLHKNAAQEWANYPAVIDTITDRLSGVVIENAAASTLIKRHNSKETLFYVDPPYVHSTRGRDQQVNYAHEMDDGAHRELAEVLHQVKGMVVLSGYLCPLYSELYGDWEVRKKSTYADGARPRVEALWLNPAAAGKQVQMQLMGV